MSKFVTQFNGKKSKDRFEPNTHPSMTVPDQTMSVKEIMDRYARGLPLGGQKVPLYDPEDDMPDPRTLDLTEIDEIAQEAKQHHTERLSRAQQKADKLKEDSIRKKLQSEKDENSTNHP